VTAAVGDCVRSEEAELSSTTKDDETDAVGRLNSDPDNPDSEYITYARSTWTKLIKKVYEVTPLTYHHVPDIA